MPQKGSSFTRRRFVQVAGGSSAVVLAGCLGDDADDTDDDDGAAPGDDGDDAAPGDDGDDAAPGDPDEEQFIEIGISSDPRTVDPIRHLSTPDRMVLNSVFNNVVSLDDDLEFYPDLAASMPEVEREGQRWIVELEQDAEFHNGDPVTAGDLEYSLTQPVVEQRGDAGDFAMIDDIEEVDEHTAQIDLEFPFARFMLSLNSLVVPADVREANKGEDDEWQDEFVGSGPFRFVDWQPGESVTLEKWDDYWKGIEPNLDEVVFNEIEEPSTRVTTLQTGESDLIEEIPGELYDTVRNMDEAGLSTTEGLRCNFIAFNCIDGPTADPQVREAIDYCIDIQQEVDLIYGDAAERMYSPIPPLLADAWDFPIDEWAEIPHDRDIGMAQQLFEEAGVDPDYEFDILISGAERADMAVSIANGIEEAGYTANVQNLEWGTFISTFNSGDADDMNVYLLGLSGDPDPGGFVYTLYHEDREGADNGHYYRDDELFGWIEEADETDDRDRRRELYIDAITRVLEQRVHLPTQVPLVSWGVADHVSGYQPHARPSINPRLVTEEYNVSVDR